MSLLNKVKSALGASASGLASPRASSSKNTDDAYSALVKSFYSPDYTQDSNWLRSTPYAFKAKVDDGPYTTFFLPISPQNLTISTYFATNTIATLYGTVEEHSEQRYFDITIQGTTGFAPAYYDKNPLTPSAGRESFSSSAFIKSDVLGGFASGLIGKINKAVNQATAVVNAVKGNSKGPFESGLSIEKSGYAAFHNLYRFLLAHKKYAASGKMRSPSDEKLDARSSNQTPLYFINFKDNNQYSCVVQRFTLERTAENPMLYNYSIQLRAYNIGPILSGSFAANDERLKMLGLQESRPSAAASFNNAISNAKGTLNTLKSIRGR